MTTKLTNKQDPRNVLYGEVLAEYSTQNYFEFRIAGTSSGNGFQPSEWDFEEFVELPTKHLAVISVTAPDRAYSRYFVRTVDGEWLEDDSDFYTDTDVRAWINDDGEKLTVIFEGIDNA